MGRITQRIKVVNAADVVRFKDGTLPGDKIRQLEVEGIIDTGARMLVLPEDLVIRLGLEALEKRTVRYANGESDVKNVGSAVILEVMGRTTECRVLIEKPGAPVLVGQIPLEDLDLVVNMSEEKLTVNPESPYLPMAEIYGTR